MATIAGGRAGRHRSTLSSTRAQVGRCAGVPWRLLGALGVLAVSPAHAQQAGSANGGAALELAPIVVTTGAPSGARTAASSLAPIDVIGEEALVRTAKRSLREALAQIVPSFKTSQGQHAGTGKGVRHATLRGLSGNETLILVNGKRRHNSALISTSANGASPADLDLIPIAAVERVEVLRDGAAAQYGSDAIAGVINIILKSNAQGGSASLLAGRYGPDEGGVGHRGATGVLSVNQGVKLGEDGGFISLSGDLAYQDDQNNWGALRDSYQIYPRINGAADPREFGHSRYRQLQGGVPREAKGNLSYNAELPVDGNVKLYSFGTYAHRVNSAYGSYRAPNNLLGASVTTQYPDGYRSGLKVKEDDAQIVAGVRANDWGGWQWDLSASYARDAAKLYTFSTANASFGPDSATGFYNGDQTYDEWVLNANARRSFKTGVFENPLVVAAGAEYRRSRWSQGVGAYQSYADGGYRIPSGAFAGQYPSAGSGFQAGYAPDQTGQWSRNNAALWLDLSQKLTQKWEASAGLRGEQFSDFGGTVSGKLSTRYEVTSAFALRGTVSNGFAAPTLQQMHYRYNQPNYNTNVNTGVVTKTGNRFVTADDAVGQALGAQQLKPEKSRNLSVGGVWKPAAATTVSLDAYQIDIRDRIRLSSQFDGTTNAVVRNALQAAGLSADQQVSYFTNIGDTRTRGIDLVAEHTTRHGDWGSVKWTLASNQNLTKLSKVAATPAVLANAGIAMVGVDAQSALTTACPKNVTSIGAAWTRGPLEVTLGVTRYAKVLLRSAQGAARDELVKAAAITDLSVGYWITDSTRITVGANNLFDKEPNQITDAALAVNSYSLARPVYSTASPYSINGAFYYARLESSW